MTRTVSAENDDEGESTHTGSGRGATENAGLENAAPDCRGGKRGSSIVWKAEVSVI